jgi:hypothetical protein
MAHVVSLERGRDRKREENKNIIIIDPSLPSAYPEYASKVLYPQNMEVRGLNPTKLQHWFHIDYIKGRASGDMVLGYLTLNGLFEDCIGLHELEGIQQKDVYFFRAYFGGEVVFGWRSLMVIGKDYWVPGLIEFGGEVMLRLFLLKIIWLDNFTALRLTEKAHIRLPAFGKHNTTNILVNFNKKHL